MFPLITPAIDPVSPTSGLCLSVRGWCLCSCLHLPLAHLGFSSSYHCETECNTRAGWWWAGVWHCTSALKFRYFPEFLHVITQMSINVALDIFHNSTFPPPSTVPENIRVSPSEDIVGKSPEDSRRASFPSTKAQPLARMFQKCSCCCECIWLGQYPAAFFICE